MLCPECSIRLPVYAIYKRFVQIIIKLRFSLNSQVVIIITIELSDGSSKTNSEEIMAVLTSYNLL